MVILAFILLVVVGVVSFLNTELMAVNLYFMSLSVPAWAIFIAFLLIGMLIAALFATSKGARNRQVIKNKNNEIERAEEEKEEGIKRVELEKEQALERMKVEKEEALERMKAEKEAAIVQTKKESDLQLELQTQEAEIQKLESQLAKDNGKGIVTEKAPIQTEKEETSVREHDRDHLINEEQITEYKIDSSPDKKGKD